MKTIIVYYSFTGNNEALALALQRRLNCEIYKIAALKKRTAFTILCGLYLKRKSKIQKPGISFSQYDHIILVAPIWDSNIATPMKDFIEGEKYNIKQYSFICVCSGREGQDEKIARQLLTLAEKKPVTVAELKVNDLLPTEKRNKIRYTTPLQD